MTTIPRTPPATASRGELVISASGSGREVTRTGLSIHDRGGIALPVKNIRSGNYIHSMIVDGRVMGSGKMIVVNEPDEPLRDMGRAG